MKITKRTITEEEFLKLKKQEPFATYRQDSKAINFGLLFNMSYIRFSSSNLETKWPLERVEAFIEEKGIQDDVIMMQERHQDQGLDPKLYKYYAVANFIKTQFFQTYPGLLRRIKRNEAFAKENGFLRSFHGGIRRLPLMTMAYGEDGKPRKHENKKELANWINISSNTTIQTDESVTINSCIADWNDPRAVLFGTVHDSVSIYVEREHIRDVLPKLKAHFERLAPEWQGRMLWPTDSEVYDLTNQDHYYKHGLEASKYLKGLNNV